MQFTSIHAVEICFHRNKMVCEKKILSFLLFLPLRKRKCGTSNVKAFTCRKLNVGLDSIYSESSSAFIYLFSCTRNEIKEYVTLFPQNQL